MKIFVNVLTQYPEVGLKIFLRGELEGSGPSEIEDPYELATDEVRACFNLVLACTDNLAKRLRDADAVQPAVREPTLPAGQIPRRREAQ
jgi:hypothetical protein